MKVLRYNILITKRCADLFHSWMVLCCSAILFISVGRFADFTHSYVCYYNAAANVCRLNILNNQFYTIFYLTAMVPSSQGYGSKRSIVTVQCAVYRLNRENYKHRASRPSCLLCLLVLVKIKIEAVKLFNRK